MQIIPIATSWEYHCDFFLVKCTSLWPSRHGQSPQIGSGQTQLYLSHLRLLIIFNYFSTLC